MNKINLIENFILKLIGIIMPWTILLASPQFHIGYWGQVEGMICYVFGISSIVSMILIKVGYSDEKFRSIFAHPLILLPINSLPRSSTKPVEAVQSAEAMKSADALA